MWVHVLKIGLHPKRTTDFKSVGNFVQEQSEGQKLNGWRGAQDSPSPTKDQAP